MGAIRNWTRQQPGVQRSRYRKFVKAIRPSCLHLRHFLWSRGPQRSLRVRRIELHKHIASTRADRRIGPHRNRNCDRVGFAVSNGEHAFMVTLVSVIAKPSQRRLMLICADVGVAISVRPVNIALLPLIAFMYGPVSGFTLSAFQSRKARTLRLARSGIATRHIQSMRIGRYAMALPTLGSAVRPLDHSGVSHTARPSEPVAWSRTHARPCTECNCCT